MFTCTRAFLLRHEKDGSMITRDNTGTCTYVLYVLSAHAHNRAQSRPTLVCCCQKKKIKSLSAAKHSFDLRRRSIFGRRISSINCVQFSATAWAEQAGTGAYPISPRPRLQDFRPRRVRMALKRAQDVFSAQRNWPGSGVLSWPSEKNN
jgi:hypothetical protein